MLRVAWVAQPDPSTLRRALAPRFDRSDRFSRNAKPSYTWPSVSKEEREEADARFKAVNERLDRLFAPQSPIDASLEERVHELERQVVTLRRFLLLVSLQTSTSRKQALEQLDRALDQIDQIEEPEPGVR